jgi:hypothetical protein
MNSRYLMLLVFNSEEAVRCGGQLIASGETRKTQQPDGANNMSGSNARWACHWIFVAMLHLLGCDTTALPPDPCKAPDDTLKVEFAFGPCIDIACTDMDRSLWRAPPNQEHPVEANIDLTCTVSIEPPTGEGALHLEACNGSPPTPYGVLARLSGTLADRLAFNTGDKVHVAYHWASDGWSHTWSHGTLRTAGGDLVALFSEGYELPDDAFASPLTLRGSAMDCEPLHELCGGTTHRGRLNVSLGDHSVMIPDHNAADIGTDPTYAVAIKDARVGEGYACGSYRWYQEFTVVAIAR